MTRKTPLAAAEMDIDAAELPFEGAAAFDRSVNHARKAHAILSAAAQAFVEKGYNQTTVADIADRLNISKPTLYYYAGNKEEILFKCQVEAINHLKDELVRINAQNLSGIEALRLFMLAVGEWISSEFAQCIARCHVDLLNPQAREDILAGRRMIDHSLREIIRRGIADGSIRECNPQTATAALFGAFNWMAHWFDPKRSSRSASEIGEEFLSYFFEGLGTGARPKKKPTH